MSIFRNLVIEEAERSRSTSMHGIPFYYSNKIQRFINPINQGKYYSVGGRVSGGKRSFVDLHFVIGAFLWWRAQPEASRPPLKIIYYNMDKSPKQKMQKMLCTYLWLCKQQLMDTNTLNGMSSRMFDIHPLLDSWIKDSEGFFNELLEVVEFKHGRNNPTGIEYDLAKYANTIGEEEVDGYDRVYKYYPQHERQITIVVIDNIKKLKNESQQGVQYNENQLHDKMNDVLTKAASHYRFTPVAIVPAWEVGGVYKLNQMVPDFRELRQYFEKSDVVFHLFNPFKFQITEYNGWNTQKFVSAEDAIPRFRVCSILKNDDGADTAQIPLLFTPENGMFVDLPKSTEKEQVEQWHQYVETFRRTQINLTNNAAK